MIKHSDILSSFPIKPSGNSTQWVWAFTEVQDYGAGFLRIIEASGRLGLTNFGAAELSAAVGPNAFEVNMEAKTIWLIYPYGRLPNEGWRDYRATMVARALTEAGHKVVWWVADFEHSSKTFRDEKLDGSEAFPGLTLRLLPSVPYRKNISFDRIRFEKNFGRELKNRSINAPSPNFIIAMSPCLFTSDLILELCRIHKAKLIVDILDLWPELFDLALPRGIRKLGKIIFASLYARRDRFYQKADAVLAVTEDYLDGARRAPCSIKRASYLGVDVAQIRESTKCGHSPELAERLHLPEKKAELWAIYAGALGPNYDLDSVLDAAVILKEQNPEVRFLIAGDGDLRAHLLERIEKETLGNVLFFGPLPVADLNKLYAFCDIALSTYVGGSTVSMPIKAYDYLAAGLPMVNSLGRELGQLVSGLEVGINYKPQSPASLAAAVKALSENAQLRLKMRNNALANSERFDSASQHRVFVDVVEQLSR